MIKYRELDSWNEFVHKRMLIDETLITEAIEYAFDEELSERLIEILYILRTDISYLRGTTK